jgi:hypothetical protein
MKCPDREYLAHCHAENRKKIPIGNILFESGQMACNITEREQNT